MPGCLVETVCGCVRLCAVPGKHGRLELPFLTGERIHVYGEERADGFYYGEANIIVFIREVKTVFVLSVSERTDIIIKNKRPLGYKGHLTNTDHEMWTLSEKAQSCLFISPA